MRRKRTSARSRLGFRTRPSRDIRAAPVDGRTGQKAVVRARPPAMLTRGSRQFVEQRPCVFQVVVSKPSVNAGGTAIRKLDSNFRFRARFGLVFVVSLFVLRFVAEA